MCKVVYWMVCWLLCISIIFYIYVLPGCLKFLHHAFRSATICNISNIIWISYESHMNILWTMKIISLWFPGSWLAHIAFQVLPPLGKETPIDGTTQDPFQGPAHTCSGYLWMWVCDVCVEQSEADLVPVVVKCEELSHRSSVARVDSCPWCLQSFV